MAAASLQHVILQQFWWLLLAPTGVTSTAGRSALVVVLF